MFYNWMLHHALYSEQKISMKYIRLLFDKYDIRPNLFIEKFKIQKQVKNNKIPLIGHIHVPKTGGTYIKTLRDILPHVNFSHVLVRKNRCDDYCPIGLMPISPQKIKGYFLFSNVRNPLTFFISYYHHVKGFGEYINSNHYDYKIAQNGFDYLIEVIMNRTDKWPGRKFLYPQLFDQDGNCIIDIINRTENLDQDLKLLCSEFGFRFESKERKRVAPNKKRPQEYYSDKLFEKVMKVYSREMKMFGYDGFEIGLNKYRTKNNFNFKYDFKKDEFL